jgi:hypothetical protein
MSGAGVMVMVCGLAFLGLLWTFSAGAKAGRAAERQFREATRVGSVLLATVVAAGVIVTVQWLVIRQNPATFAGLVVLGVPALLAGMTVARLAAVTTVVRGSSRKGVRR